MSPFFRWNLKRNDLLPAVSGTVTNARLPGQPATVVDLSAAGTTVRFLMREPNGATKVEAFATITDGVNGRVRYDWVPGDTDTAGIYYGEFEIIFPSGKPATVPNGPPFQGRKPYIIINIEEDVPPIGP